MVLRTGVRLNGWIVAESEVLAFDHGAYQLVVRISHTFILRLGSHELEVPR